VNSSEHPCPHDLFEATGDKASPYTLDRKLNVSSILDISDLMFRLNNDREFLAELFAIFKADLPPHLQRLRQAVEHNDAKEVQTEGHSLKGMLLNLSATQAAVAAGELELIGRENRVENMKLALSAFEREVAALLPEIENCSNESSS
jgi:HPt (histidine-containing phosphotransfer) domain-containing protein